MQIATVKMNMIYKTYTCQFPKNFGTPTTQGFPSHSTILAGLVAQTFQNPWRKLPWNHDHLTTDHAQAGHKRSWLQGFDDFEWFWCIVQSMCRSILSIFGTPSWYPFAILFSSFHFLSPSLDKKNCKDPFSAPCNKGREHCWTGVR